MPLRAIALHIVLVCVPTADELDFRVLPAANTVATYKFSVTLSIEGKPSVTLPFTVARAAGPADVTELLVFRPS